MKAILASLITIKSVVDPRTVDDLESTTGICVFFQCIAFTDYDGAWSRAWSGAIRDVAYHVYQ
jgi:hypothetical protein